MILGIGIDIVELDRIKRIAEQQEKFIDRILTETEKFEYHKLSAKRKTEFLAGRFAAKEAFAKAAGTGIGHELSFLDIEIVADDKGKPFIVKPYRDGVHLSISHSRDFAVAQVVIEDNK